jgi:hypothetical protein
VHPRTHDRRNGDGMTEQVPQQAPQQIPLDTFPDEMVITREFIARLNDAAAAEGAISSGAALAAMINALGKLEVQVIGLWSGLSEK